MRRVLLALAFASLASVAQAQHPARLWIYRNPQTGANGWGYNGSAANLQFGTSARQDRVYHFTPYYQPYYGYQAPAYYGGFNPNPWYGGFGAAY